MPVLTIIAGPNGSGKSSVIRDLGLQELANLLEADAIAKRMDPADPRRAAVAAGREVIRRTREYLASRESFAMETTLASVGTLEIMREAKALGYTIRFVYVCLDSPDRNIQRVSERAAAGGHDVPDPDIRRRYERSLRNFPEALRLADHAAVFDNSENRPKKLMEMAAGAIVWLAPDLPGWFHPPRN